jgi:type I restriction enzyme, S subunit
LEGLEASILSLSEILADNRDKRLDSQYFRRAALVADTLLAQHNPQPIFEIASDVRSFGAYALTNEFEYQENGIPFLRGTNYSGDFITFTDVLRISEDANRLLHKSEIKPGMVLLSMSGSVGSVAVALDTWRYPINSNQDIAKIVPNGISSFYLAAFLSCRFGRIQVNRLPVGSVQQHVFLWMIERLKVPRFSSDFEARIAKTALNAYQAHETAFDAVSVAEVHLTKALGLVDWTPPEPLAYTARALDVFAAGRIDAQYYMPAKEQVRRSLEALPGKPLSDRANSIREQWVPERAPPTMRIRNYDVTDALVPLLDAEKEPSSAAEIGSMKKVFKDGDVVISRLRAYLKEIAVVRTGDEIPSVGSSEFIVLRPKGDSISPETLLVFLRSTPVQTILRWCQDGSQHPRFSEGDLLSISVPDAVVQMSPRITQIVRDGFAARLRARKLLDAAKRAVEIAIENSEAEALAYLDQQEEAN